MSRLQHLLRWVWLVAGLGIVAALGGCAHPYSLSPNLGTVVGTGGTKIDKKVGLHITEADRNLEVTTPGGGGDKVRYFPYRDLETGLYAALGEVFAGVTRIAGPADPKVLSEPLNLIVTPSLQTTSFSDSVFTWPPTIFTVELVCKITDAKGGPVAELRVVGDGRASFDEFKSELSLSGRRASEDLLKKLIAALRASTALR